MPPTAAIAELAARQHGVVATWQLRRIGLSGSAIQRRIDSGLLHPLHRGVFSVGFRNLTPHTRLTAARLAIGEGAAVGHFGAGYVHGFASLRSDRPVDIIAPRGRCRPGRRPGIVVHQTRFLPPKVLVSREGIWCTSVPRTLIDLAGRCTQRHLTRLYEEADRMGCIDRDSMAVALRRAGGRRGLGWLRRLHATHSLPAPHSESHAEHRFFRLWEQSGPPMPEVNALVLGYRVDFLWRDIRMIVELDGPDFHDRKGQAERDRQRDIELRIAGHAVHRFGTEAVYANPGGLISQVKRLLKIREREVRATR